jgi:hypothetical protein
MQRPRDAEDSGCREGWIGGSWNFGCLEDEFKVEFEDEDRLYRSRADGIRDRGMDSYFLRWIYRRFERSYLLSTHLTLTLEAELALFMCWFDLSSLREMHIMGSSYFSPRDSQCACTMPRRRVGWICRVVSRGRSRESLHVYMHGT